MVTRSYRRVSPDTSRNQLENDTMNLVSRPLSLFHINRKRFYESTCELLFVHPEGRTLSHAWRTSLDSPFRLYLYPFSYHIDSWPKSRLHRWMFHSTLHCRHAFAWIARFLTTQLGTQRDGGGYIIALPPSKNCSRPWWQKQACYVPVYTTHKGSNKPRSSTRYESRYIIILPPTAFFLFPFVFYF